jgi:hypothetical protein
MLLILLTLDNLAGFGRRLLTLSGLQGMPAGDPPAFLERHRMLQGIVGGTTKRTARQI